jgi:hypothetical protein
MGDHGDADPVDLVLSFCSFNDLFKRIKRPVDSNKGLSLGAFSPRSREAAEMASSHAAFLIMKKEVQTFQFCVPMKGSLLEAQRERGSKAGLNILGTDFVIHGYSFSCAEGKSLRVRARARMPVLLLGKVICL